MVQRSNNVLMLVWVIWTCPCDIGAEWVCWLRHPGTWKGDQTVELPVSLTTESDSTMPSQTNCGGEAAEVLGRCVVERKQMRAVNQTCWRNSLDSLAVMLHPGSSCPHIEVLEHGLQLPAVGVLTLPWAPPCPLTLKAAFFLLIRTGHGWSVFLGKQGTVLDGTAPPQCRY